MRTLHGVLTLALLTGCVVAQDASLDPALLPEAPRLEFDPPEVTRVTLANGIELFLLEDHELPLLEVRSIIRTGDVFDPPDKIGVADATGAVMRTGGTSAMTGDELDEELENMAAAIETGIGSDAGSASLSCLMRDADRCVELLASVLRDPAFREDKIELHLNQVRESLRRMNDDPRGITSREFNWLLFDKSNAWVDMPTMEMLDGIGPDDLKAFHARFYHPDRIMMAIAGDFEIDEMVALIEKHFGDWEPSGEEAPALPAKPDDLEPGVYFIHRADLNQSNVRLGHYGPGLHGPDHHELQVMNFLYGTSGFTSMLMREVRSNRGLTYGIGGAVREAVERGVYYVVTFTKSETTGEIIDVILDVTRDFESHPPTAEELDLAKTSEANSFVFRFDSSISIANEKMSLAYRDYPDDYLETYLDQIDAVTAEDVARVAQEYIDPDNLVILVVGNEEQIGDQLDHLGEVHPVPLIDFTTGEQIWPESAN